TRRLTGRPGEVLVAAAPQAALRNHDARARLREIGDELVAVEDLRPDRYAEDRVLSARAVRETASAASAATAAELLVRTKAGKVAPSRVGDDHDVAAVTAVSPVRPTARHVFLAPEMDRAVAAAAGDGRQARTVVEHGLLGVDDRDEAALAARPERDLAVTHR